MSSIHLDVPVGWTEIDPPEGATLAFVDTVHQPSHGRVPFRTNVIVTVVQRPDRIDEARVPQVFTPDVSGYLDAVLDALVHDLDEVEIFGIWTGGSADGSIAQRIGLRHVHDGAEIELIQQHHWFDHVIGVVSASIPVTHDDDAANDAANDAAAVISACLNSLLID